MRTMTCFLAIQNLVESTKEAHLLITIWRSTKGHYGEQSSQTLFDGRFARKERFMPKLLLAYYLWR